MSWTTHSCFSRDIINAWYFINLAERTDRLKSMQQFFRKLDIPETLITRVDALYNCVGFRGCTASHIKALEYMEADTTSPSPYVVLMEDDLEWVDEDAPSRFISLWNDFLMKNVKMDVFFFTMTPLLIWSLDEAQTVSEAHKKSSQVVRVKRASGMAGLIIRRGYLSKLRKMYERAQLNNEPHDVTNETEQMQDNWYGIYPPLIRQKAGYSDIERTEVNYATIENGALLI